MTGRAGATLKVGTGRLWVQSAGHCRPFDAADADAAVQLFLRLADPPTN